jgi:hypothetical protein
VPTGPIHAITDHQFEQLSIYRGAFGLKGELGDIVHKPLPQAHIHPGNPRAERTTGRTGTMNRTGTIVHPPS